MIAIDTKKKVSTKTRIDFFVLTSAYFYFIDYYLRLSTALISSAVLSVFSQGKSRSVLPM